ncbi:hypothetical protein V1478_003779 [Vespula squamosa]|uniref:Uncharacterized protein n=1 Tax=Vespula squamosa TaxID=30214 RepID=A0ABD2BMT0_VESSQ
MLNNLETFKFLVKEKQNIIKVLNNCIAHRPKAKANVRVFSYFSSNQCRRTPSNPHQCGYSSNFNNSGILFKLSKYQCAYISKDGAYI